MRGRLRHPHAAAGLLAALALFAGGCAARPLAVKPAEALAIARAQPEVGAWIETHSAPRVLEGLAPAAARGLTRYQPVAMVDLADEGLLIRFDAALGPRPRRVEVTLDRGSGAVLSVKQR